MFTRGTLEVLQVTEAKELTFFNDIANISVDGKRISSATVSKRLNELINANAIETVITKSKKGRRVIAYKVTGKGRKVIKIANELKEALAIPKDVR